MEDLIDIIKCLILFDDSTTDYQKARYLDIIQRDLRKSLNYKINSKDMTQIIIYKNKPYSNFKLFCSIHGIKYNTWNKKSFPIMFEGEYIYKETLIKQCC